jgi:inner membrane protein
VILAHLPAGYILAHTTRNPRGPLLWAALAGAVFPDFDMFWFHFVDNASIHHHRYWVHVPGFWIMIGIPALLILRGQARAMAAMFLAAIAIHLVLDSVGGGIMWLWPWSDHLFSIVTVPATQSHWVLSFLVHWSFLLELATIATAAVLWLRR